MSITRELLGASGGELGARCLDKARLKGIGGTGGIGGMEEVKETMRNGKFESLE